MAVSDAEKQAERMMQMTKMVARVVREISSIVRLDAWVDFYVEWPMIISSTTLLPR